MAAYLLSSGMIQVQIIPALAEHAYLEHKLATAGITLGCNCVSNTIRTGAAGESKMCATSHSSQEERFAEAHYPERMFE